MTRTLRRLAVVAASLCVAVALLALPSLASAAADPDHVSFTLEGCRLPVGAALPVSVICDDSQYTPGNLGKSWNELDLVPYRLTASNGGPEQTYTMAVALDAEDAGKPGYDVISAPKLNLSHSTSAAACDITVLGGVSGEKTMGPAQGGGLGGIDVTRYRELTVHQAAGATCVFDYYGRLAVGSHEFPGSSLHGNKALVSDPGDATTGEITTSGIGAADVSIPVKEITPQKLTAELTAKEGSAYTWSVSKTTSPLSLNFGNTCGFTDAERTATVTVTVEWTREDPSPNGEVKVRTIVSAENPAAREITVNASANVYEGSTTTTPVGSTLTGTVDVPANSKLDVIDHTELYSGSATSFNAIATAGYTDKLTGIPVTGTTSATATATVQPSGDPATSASATITDTESLTGDPDTGGTGEGLSFSSADPTTGAFTNYTAGVHTTGPVNWSSGVVSSSGSAEFTKTVYLDQPRNTSGILTDTAEVHVGIGPDNVVADATANVPIAATRSCATVTFAKVTVPAEPGSGATAFAFTPSESLDGDQTVFTLHDGQGKPYSDLRPGVEYSAVEAEHKGYRLTDVSCDSDNGAGFVELRGASVTPVAGEHVTCTFENTKVNTSIEIVKTGTPDVVHDGDNVTFTYAVSNPSSNNGSITDVVVSDDKCADIKGPNSKTGGDDDDVLDPGETWTYSCTTPAKHGDEDSSHVITNVATASGKDPFGDPVSDQDDDTTKVIHPAIKIDKTGPATVEAGQKISYVLTVTNPGDTPLAGSTVVVSDPQCNADAVTLLSTNGDASPGTLNPGDVWTYTCSLQTAAGAQSVENHATVEGKDQLGKVVDSAAVAATVLTPPQQVVLGARVTPGTARLLGPTGCQAKAFNARIRGSKMATLTFVLDGKVVKKVKNTKNAAAVSFRINPTKLRVGVHRLVVTVTFQAGSGTKPKTFRLSFQRCAKKLVSPRFTG